VQGNVVHGGSSCSQGWFWNAATEISGSGSRQLKFWAPVTSSESIWFQFWSKNHCIICAIACSTKYVYGTRTQISGFGYTIPNVLAPVMQNCLGSALTALVKPACVKCCGDKRSGTTGHGKLMVKSSIPTAGDISVSAVYSYDWMTPSCVNCWLVVSSRGSYITDELDLAQWHVNLATALEKLQELKCIKISG